MESIDLSQINYLAVLVGALAHLMIGLVWYSKQLFGNTWAELTGETLTPAWRWIPLAIVGHLVSVFVLAVLIQFAGATTAFGGLAMALLAWLGFIVTLEIGELVWEKISFRLFLIRIGEHLLALSAAGLIVGAWR